MADVSSLFSSDAPSDLFGAAQSPWVQGWNEQGFPYWFNTLTGEASWSAPEEAVAPSPEQEAREGEELALGQPHLSPLLNLAEGADPAAGSSAPDDTWALGLAPLLLLFSLLLLGL